MPEPIDDGPSSTIEKPRAPALGILNELSTGTYVSYTRALKELLSNAWDALATKVQIKISPDLNEITILDDGVGMSEDDIRKRFLRIGGSSRVKGAVRNNRRLIGHKGIGALSVIPICREVRVLTTKADSTDRIEAVLDVPRIIEKAKQQEDLETHYVYTLNKWGNEPTDSHYTFISLRNLTPDMQEFLAHKGVTITQYISSVSELSGIEQLKWELAMLGPVAYPKDGPFKEDIAPMRQVKKELSKARFTVFVNNEQLFKPIVLPSADIKYTAKYKRGIDYEIYPIEHSDDDLEFKGYIFSQGTAVMPSDFRGGLIRVNNVAIGTYDINWMKYQKHVGPRLGLTTGEIYVYRGLENALLIERDRFRETDPAFKRFREIVHRTLKESFGGATRRSRYRASIQKQQQAETFHQKMEAKVSQYLSRAYRERPVSLELEELGNKPPFLVDARHGKVQLNTSHKIFKKLKPNEKEIVEAFLIAIGIAKERSAGDSDRMLDEIFKIITDLLEARHKH
jgi:Histidine kinase-, DNA gyrase B-, and HSP90-like ATPase